MELIIGENARKCTFCNKIKHFDEFHRHKHAKYGRRSTCIPCNKYKKENKELIKIRNKFKIFLEKTTQTKVCTSCNKRKSFSEFWKLKSNVTHGLKSQCIICEKSYQRIAPKSTINYKKNRKKFFKKQKLYSQQKKKCRNCKEILPFSEFWKDSNTKLGLRYFCKTCDYNVYNKKWHQENKEQASKNSTKYITKRRKEDMGFRMLTNLRGRIYRALAKNEKSDTTKELLGCTIKKLKQHIEDQFDEHMNWDNYGFYGWHIDHIRPCASFDLSDPEQQKECFHYTNLQPLWSYENMCKKDKLDWNN